MYVYVCMYVCLYVCMHALHVFVHYLIDCSDIGTEYEHMHSNKKYRCKAKCIYHRNIPIKVTPPVS